MTRAAKRLLANHESDLARTAELTERALLVRKQMVNDREGNWTKPAAVADGVSRGESWALADLYQRMCGVRVKIYGMVSDSFLRRGELDDLFHDAYIATVCQLQREPMREPERLMGFVATVTARVVIRHMTLNLPKWKATGDLAEFEESCDASSSPSKRSVTHDPLQTLLEREQAAEMAASVRYSLTLLSAKHREILIRFYLSGQSRQQICAEMDLTENQYRVAKSRAKARFGRLGKQYLSMYRHARSESDSRALAR
jgi:DNA-directed RNA polymerase specialized sigma24 family protein